VVSGFQNVGGLEIGDWASRLASSNRVTELSLTIDMRSDGNAKHESLLQQYVSRNAGSSKIASCVSKQLYQDMEKAELLWSLRRTRLLRGYKTASRSGRIEISAIGVASRSGTFDWNR